MQMLQCPNCGKLTGFKRNLGFGTFFMVVITAGLWLLAIPFYPVRCINCGIQRPSRHVLAFISIGGLFLFAIAILNINKSQHAQQNDGSTASLSQSSNDYQQSNSPVSGNAESVIRISAQKLLAEFQRSEADKEARIKNESLSTYLSDNTETAEARYKGKRIELTGIVTGVFIPSLETSQRILESRGKGIFDEHGGADSFITMGGPYPHSAEETLLLPGITAWSKKGDSLQPTFGRPNSESLAGQLVVGRQATLLCTFSSSSASSPTDVSVSLENCVLEPSSPSPAPTASAEIENRSMDAASLIVDHPDMKTVCGIAGGCDKVRVTLVSSDHTEETAVEYPKQLGQIRVEIVSGSMTVTPEFAKQVRTGYPIGSKMPEVVGRAWYKPEFADAGASSWYTVTNEVGTQARVMGQHAAYEEAIDMAINGYILYNCGNSGTPPYCN
jgi:hypothetical protein